jgi:two-component system, cell cycle response regulator
VPEVILSKPTELDAAEWEAVRRHPDVGADILSLAPGLRDVAEVVRQHHEPPRRHGLSERFLRRADLHRSPHSRGVQHVGRDVLRSASPHFPHDPQAVHELRRAAGSQLHPQVVEAFLSVLSRTEELAGATS